MRIIVTAGGTGGHVFPALEIVKEIKQQNKKIEVIFVGNKNSLEAKLAQKANIEFYPLNVKGLLGQNFLKKVLALCFLTWAVLNSVWLLKKKQPKAVIGVGGYVSAPIVIASFLLGIRRYICEQNVIPGFANKTLAKVANKIFISFRDSAKFFNKEKTIFSGNPVRSEFFSKQEKKLNKSFKVLITGGSQGAKFLNEEIPRALANLHFHCNDLQVTHQTGVTMQKQVADFYQKHNINAKCISFIENMPNAFLENNLLISRAGATVCAEIMAFGMPAVLIPYPYANAHQYKNAIALSNMGAAITVSQERGDFLDCLANTLKDLYTEPNKLTAMSRKAKSMGTKRAASKIVDEIFNDLKL